MCPENGAWEVPKIDFSALRPDRPGCEGWAEARAQVAEALRTYGWFEAVYEKVTPELKEKVFGSAVKELFDLPLDAKVRNVSGMPFRGYIGQNPDLRYESLAILQPHEPDGVKAFAEVMWPHGIPDTFCETVCGFSKLLAELDQMVRRMVLESLGVGKHHDSLMKVHNFLLRLSEYRAPDEDEEQKKMVGLLPHRDKNTLSIVCQNQVDGLEMQTQDGQWILARPSPSSVIVMAGDTLRVWTNGQTYSPLHTVKVGGNVTRYSTTLFSRPKDDLILVPLPELVDESHPALFRPYTYRDYMHFWPSEGGDAKLSLLDAFCRIAPP